PFEDWITSHPWLEGGGVRIARISPGMDVEEVMDAVARAVRGEDDGNVGVRLHRLGTDVLRGGLETAVAQALELPSRTSRREYVKNVADVMTIRPAIFLANASGIS